MKALVIRKRTLLRTANDVQKRLFGERVVNLHEEIDPHKPIKLTKAWTLDAVFELLGTFDDDIYLEKIKGYCLFEMIATLQYFRSLWRSFGLTISPGDIILLGDKAYEFTPRKEHKFTRTNLPEFLNLNDSDNYNPINCQQLNRVWLHTVEEDGTDRRKFYVRDDFKYYHSDNSNKSLMIDGLFD